MRLLRALLPALLLTLAALQAQDGVAFRQQYKIGHRYHQTTSTAQEMDLDLGGQTMDQKMSMTVGMEAVVTPQAGGTQKRVTIRYDRAAASISAQGQKFSYDSANEDTSNSGPLRMFGGVVGRSFDVIFDSNEEVIGVEKLDDALGALAGSHPFGANMYREMFTPEAVKRMMQQSVLRSPNARPLKVGEGWPFAHDVKLPNIGKLKIAGQYTFTTMTERNGVKCAEVRAAADITLDVSEIAGADDESRAVATQMKMTLEQGRLQGVIYYDPAIDFTRELEIEQRMTLTAKIPDGSGKMFRLPMKQVITMKLDAFEPVTAEAKPAPAPAPKNEDE